MTISFTITGQVRGGKNNMVVTRDGKHFPKKSWAQWRDAAVSQVKRQIPHDWKAVDQNIDVHFDYVAGDKKRRDFPAICDAVWHVLEKAGVVADDTHLWPSQSRRTYDKTAPHVTVTIPLPVKHAGEAPASSKPVIRKRGDSGDWIWNGQWLRRATLDDLKTLERDDPC